MPTIRNPAEWGVDQVKETAEAVRSVGHAVAGGSMEAPKTLNRITVADLREALSRGLKDFGTYRTDVMFICIIYPVVGLILINLALDHALIPLLFPLAAGFALVAPVAAVGLYEMSRRREKGEQVSWADAFAVMRSPSFGAIFILGLGLLVLFALWVGTAHVIYTSTFGVEPPASLMGFIGDVLTTQAGWTLIAVGVGTGFVFAVVVLALSVLSFPMLVDRDVGLVRAVWTSVRAVAANPVPMAVWGAIVAGLLVLGSIPLFLGLIIVMPVLGHATWHLYRKVVPQ